MKDIPWSCFLANRNWSMFLLLQSTF